jgi:hypothetical protein
MLSSFVPERSCHWLIKIKDELSVFREIFPTIQGAIEEWYFADSRKLLLVCLNDRLTLASVRGLFSSLEVQFQPRQQSFQECRQSLLSQKAQGETIFNSNDPDAFFSCMSNQMDEAVKSTPISIEQDLMEPELKMVVEPKLTDDGGQGEDIDEKVSMPKNTCTKKEGPSSIVQTSSSADLFDINNCFNYPEIMEHVNPDSDLQRIPFSIRLNRLGIMWKLGISVTDSEDVIHTQRQLYELIHRGIPPTPLPSAPVPSSGSKSRTLYVLYDSPIFILAQSIAHSHLQMDECGNLSFPSPPSTDEKILDVMIDSYEDYCLKSLHAHKAPRASNGFHHALLQSQFNILVPSMVCRDLLKAAMVGLLRGGDIIDSIEYDVKSVPPSKSATTKKTSATENAASNTPIYVSNLDIYRQKVRRQKTTFHGKRQENAFETMFRNLMSNPRNYPLDLKFVRILSVPLPPKLPQESIPPKVNDMVEERPAPQTTRHNKRSKRSKVESSSTTDKIRIKKVPVRSSSSVTSHGTNSSQVIIIDSDDDEEKEVDVLKPPTAAEKTINVDVDVGVDVIEQTSTSKQAASEDKLNQIHSPSLAPPPSAIVYPHYMLFPDPIPKFTCNTFVFIASLKIPGYIINIRVVREPTSIITLLRSCIVYDVYVKFGLAYVREIDLQPINNSTFLKYDGVIITQSDQLRLWPSIYLNDSLINFYLKWIKKKYQSQDIFIFPTYFYTRVGHFEEGGVVYKDNKEDRGKLWNDVKGWTKEIDIFSKSFILFPINFHKHWSFVLLCNPGKFLRVPPLKNISSRREKQLREDDHKVDIVTHSDSKNRKSVIKDLPSLDETAIDTRPIEADEMKVVNRIDDDVKEVTSSDNPGDVDVSMDTGSHIDDAPSTDSKPCLIHFDSGKRFKSHTAADIFSVIRKYLYACYEATMEDQYPRRVVDAKSIPGINPNVQQQENAEDCGVYMLEFMERLLINPYSLDDKAIIRMSKNHDKGPGNFWFTAEVAAQKRESIYCLISILAKEYSGIDLSK